MIKKLIINADDFGMTRGVTQGILLSHREGLLTSTTCMMNMPYIETAIQEAQKYPQLGLGVHLVLTFGRPLIPGAKSFTDENGNFIHVSKYPNGHPSTDPDELYAEWKAQIEKFIRLTGHKPTHLDSHHHVHLLPEHVEVAKRLAREYDLPIRQRNRIMNEYEYVPLTEEFYEDDVNFETFKSVCEKYDQTLELMTHPGFIDQPLYDTTKYCFPRMREVEVITSSKTKEWVEENHIQLINFSNVQKDKG